VAMTTILRDMLNFLLIFQDIFSSSWILDGWRTIILEFSIKFIRPAKKYLGGPFQKISNRINSHPVIVERWNIARWDLTFLKKSLPGYFLQVGVFHNLKFKNGRSNAKKFWYICLLC